MLGSLTPGNWYANPKLLSTIKATTMNWAFSLMTALKATVSLPVLEAGRKFFISIILRSESSTTVTSFDPENHRTWSSSPVKWAFRTLVSPFVMPLSTKVESCCRVESRNFFSHRGVNDQIIRKSFLRHQMTTRCTFHRKSLQPGQHLTISEAKYIIFNLEILFAGIVVF